jgi:hypothetical protein
MPDKTIINNSATDEIISIQDAVNKDIASARSKRLAKQSAKELTIEEQIDELTKFISHEPLIREIDYKILEYCTTRKGLFDIEEQIATYPEFKSAPRDQYSLLMELVHHHGLEFFELDMSNNVISEEDKQGLSENEIDDLIVGFAFQTTTAGKAVVRDFNPTQRLQKLIEAKPNRQLGYVTILDFLREKHSFADVDLLLRERDILGHEFGIDGQVVQSSVYIDKLERAGAVFFDGGWQATEAGVQFINLQEAVK